jgi:hypothetical protein
MPHRHGSLVFESWPAGRVVRMEQNKVGGPCHMSNINQYPTDLEIAIAFLEAQEDLFGEFIDFRFEIESTETGLVIEALKRLDSLKTLVFATAEQSGKTMHIAPAGSEHQLQLPFGLSSDELLSLSGRN